MSRPINLPPAGLQHAYGSVSDACMWGEDRVCGGVKALSLAAADGLFCFRLNFPKRLGHIIISSAYWSRMLSLYGLIKGGRKRRKVMLTLTSVTVYSLCARI